MNRFYGEVGYGIVTNTTPGVWAEEIQTRNYYGNIEKISRRLQPTEYLNDDILITNRISIVADAFAYENFAMIKYVKWMGQKWKVVSLEVERPRIVMTLGGLYNE